MLSFRRDSGRWIVSRSQDLLWFQGSVVAGLVLLVLFKVLPKPPNSNYLSGVPMLFTLFLWGTFFDGTHVWATYLRTYFASDRDSRAQLPSSWSFFVLALGPVIALLGAYSGKASMFEWFLLGAYLWAYWHLVRQHFGFVMMYRRRAGETDIRAARVDTCLLWVGCLYPFILFSLSESYRDTGLPQLIPVASILYVRTILSGVFATIIASLITLIVSERFEQLKLGPKHLLIAIVIVFHMLVFTLLGDLLSILATLTIFHNLQYHRIVWMYERGLGRTPAGGLLPYLGQGALFGALWYGIRVLGVSTARSEMWRDILLGLGWGVAFHHYLIDGRIWHVRRSRSLSSALEIREVAA